MWRVIKPSRRTLRAWQLIVLVANFGVWHVTLFETVLAFAIGTVLGLGAGLSLALSPVILANARMLGVRRRQSLRHVYLPSATSWVFGWLHTSAGLAFVGAVVGAYLGSSQGVGHLILQAEGSFDINTVMAGILVLTLFALPLDAIVGRKRTKAQSSDVDAAR